jgi:hypothetical protein
MIRPMRFKPSLPAIAMLAMVAVVPCIAQENHTEATRTSTVAGDHNGVVGKAGSQSAHAADASGETEKDSRATASKNAGNDVIDARIAPAPTHRGQNDALRVRPISVPSPRNMLRRRMPVVGAPHPAIRNTIGVTVHHDVAGIITPAAVTPPKFSRRVAPVSIKPVTISKGAINGTGLVHHASAPVIGGPASAIGGISGSSFRSKHAARP